MEGRTLLSVTTEVGDAVVKFDDGSIVVAGTTDDAVAGTRLKLAKYDAEGELQAVNVLNVTAFISAMTLYGTDRIVAAGSIGGEFAVMRFTANLTLDPTFDGDGIAVAFEPGSQARDLAVQSDGKIIAVGQAYDSIAVAYDIGVARFTDLGALDTTFGDLVGAARTGMTTADTSGLTGSTFGSEDANAVALDGLGGIVVAATVPLAPGDGGFGVAKFTSVGELDQTFGDGGLVVTEVTPGDEGDEVAGIQVLPDGGIVVAGTAYFQGMSSLDSVALVGYNADGSVNTTFGSGFMFDTTVVVPAGAGISIHLLDTLPTNDGLPLRAQAKALGLLGTRLVVAATVTQTNGGIAGETELGLFGFTPDGHRDTTFGEDGDLHPGVYLYDTGDLATVDAFEDVRAMAVTGTEIVVGGGVSNQAPSVFLMVRFAADGVPGGGGAVNLPPTGNAGGPYGVDEGASVLLTASGSDPEDGVNVSYSWDLDDDGTFETPGQSVLFQPNVIGSATLARKVQIADSVGQVIIASATINVNNVAPTAAIGPVAGPLSEGTDVTISGSASDPGGGSLTFHWNVTGGGQSLNGTGGGFTFAPADNGQYTITLTVSDGHGGSDVQVLTVNVSNVAPVAQLQTNAGQLTPVRQWDVAMTGSATDAGTADTHTYAWQVFDPASMLVASGTGTNVTFTPVSGGTHTVTLIVTDDDGGTGSIDVPVFVNTHWLDPDGVLRVGGTSGNDDIDLTTNSAGNVRVLFSGASAGPASAATRVIVRAGSGRDDVTIAEGLPRQTSVHGGAGADTLRGSGAGDLLFGEGGGDSLLGNAGADILVGGDGNDLLVGGKGDDLLIGGRGADSLVGNQNDDVIVGGWTRHDTDPAGLLNVLRVWQRRADYASGVASLRVAGVLLEDVDVFDDNARDVMTGDAGLDVFYGNFSRPTSTLDVITDLKAIEFALDLDLILQVES